MKVVATATIAIRDDAHSEECLASGAILQAAMEDCIGQLEDRFEGEWRIAAISTAPVVLNGRTYLQVGMVGEGKEHRRPGAMGSW